MPIEIPGYRIEGQLGRGGMAAVYLATQESLRRKVALKIMNPALTSDRSCCERFLKEGRIIAALVHPNVVTVHDVGMAGSLYYLAMEFLANGTLAERIKAGLSPDQALRILTKVTGALQLAHQHGVVHRDIKPANILFRNPETPVLSDFGVAKAASRDTQMTIVGSVIGTPDYMSPEQAIGQPVDARSDLYSLGVVFFEMLTGRHPFRSPDTQTTAVLQTTESVPQLPAHLAHFQPIIDGLLARDRACRFASADALIAALAHGDRPGTSDRPSLGLASSGSTGESTRLVTAPERWPAGAQVSTAEGRTTRGRKPWTVRLLAMGGICGALAVGAYFALGPPSVRVAAPPQGPPLSQPTGSAPGSFSETNETPVANHQSNHLAPQIQAKIDRLLLAAEGHLLMARLTEPPGSNAADAFQRVLELDPDNFSARAGLKHIADTYAEMADESVRAGRYDEARTRIEAGLGVVPDHATLRELRDKLVQTSGKARHP
jgi:serine/threonine-protein kinase PpkA